jgi:hypothetical protein
MSGTSECASRREESKIGGHSAARHRPGSTGAAYRLIGNAYRAPNRFVILQRTNAAAAVAACKPRRCASIVPHCTAFLSSTSEVIREKSDRDIGHDLAAGRSVLPF